MMIHADAGAVQYVESEVPIVKPIFLINFNLPIEELV